MFFQSEFCVFLLTMIVLLFYSVFQVYSAFEENRPFLTFIVFLVSIFISIFVYVLFSTILYLKNKGTVGEHFLEITENGLIEKTKDDETITKWTESLSIKVIWNYTFILHERKKFLIIPSQSSLLEGDIYCFLDEFKKKMQCSSN